MYDLNQFADEASSQYVLVGTRKGPSPQQRGRVQRAEESLREGQNSQRREARLFVCLGTCCASTEEAVIEWWHHCIVVWIM